MKRFSSVTGIALIALAALAPAADAQLYLAQGDENQGRLYTVDPVTATPTLVGPILIGGTTQTGVTGLAFQPGTNVLYAVTIELGPSARSLLTINPTNGNAALVGSLGSSPIPDISFSSSGTLYGWQKNTGRAIRGTLGRTPLAAISDGLVTINLATGAATPIGSPGIT